MIRKLLYLFFLFLSKCLNSPFEKYLVSNLKMLCLGMFFVLYGASAQVSTYTFSQSTGTFSSITGTTAIAANWDDAATANNIPFNFTFRYNNANYTTCSINANGSLTFGSAAANNEWSPISSGTTYAGAISAFGMDLTGNTSIVYTTTGTAPNRVFIAEWKSARRYNTGANDGNLNFQIRLSESTNLIQIIYGSCTTNSTNLTAQVGLRGSSNADYNNRSVTTGTWATSTAGGNNTAACSNNSGRLPSSGLTFNWTPVCSTNSFTSVVPITSVSFNTLLKTTSASSTTAYENFTGDITKTNVAKGQYYPLTVKGNTGGNVNGYYTAFIDWNNDGDFDDSGEYFVIGTINNSSGTDTKAASAYIQVPVAAATGNIKMRIIGRVGSYNTTPCSAVGSIGQIEDYLINVLSGCSGTSGNPVSTSASVCPNSPFVLSLPSSTLTDGASYVWQTSLNGNAPWTDATTKQTTFFGTELFNSLPANTNVYGTAAITGGQLVLTSAVNSSYGAYVIQNTPGINVVDAFTVNFDYQIPSGGGGADGFSLSYAGDITSDATGGENGEGTGIIIQFDTYDNEGVAVGSRIRIQYAGNTLFNSAIDAPPLRPTSGNTPVILTVDARGRLLLKVNGQTVVSDLALPAAYLSANKSTWKFKFAARTGAWNDIHAIDNLLIRYLDIANSGSTFTTSQTAKTYYRVVTTCGGSPTPSGSVMVDMTSATINPMTALACTGVAFTVTPNATNGTIPSGTTYTWTAPVVTGGMTNGAASTGSPTTITGTLLNPTTAAQTATYTVTPITGACTGTPFTLTVTVNPLPIPTFTAQPTAICVNTDVTYTTQAGMSNYVWGFPGTAGLDYTITSVLTSTSNTVTLKYLTATSKTVTVNYTNANGCTATASTSSSAIVASPATVAGSVGGGATVCTGTNSTALTLTGHTGSVLRWESSLDNFATAGTPITNTTANFTATNLTATTSYRAVVQSGSCGALNSASATVTVSPATVAGSVGGGTTVCTGTNSTGLTLTGHTGSVVRWESSLNNFATAGTPIANTTANFTATNLTATTSYRAVVQSGSCGVLNSASATVTVSPATVAGSVGGGTTVCTGTNSTALTLTGHTGSVVRWESSLDNFATAGTPITNTTANFTATNLTATTSYRAVVQSGSCGALNSTSTTIIISPTTIAGSVGGSTAVCSGTNSTTLTLTGHTGNVVRWESSLNNFATAGTTITNTTTSLTATNLTATTSYRAVVQSGSCGAVNSASATITVNPLPGTPLEGTKTPFTCTEAGSVLLSGLPAGSWTLTQIGTANNIISNSGATFTVTGLIPGNYTFTVNNGTCTSLPSATITIDDSSSTTWNGSTWSNSTPNATKGVIFAGAYTITSDLEACSCTINSGVNLVVPTGRTLKITNALHVTAGGSLTFEDSSSLVQVNDASVNTGKITYKRISKKIRQADFVYWSTPVNPQKLIDVSEGTQYNMYMGFTGTNWLVTDRNTDMMVGKGYIIRGPQHFSNTSRADYQASFKGVPNNGLISGETLQAGKFYLIGNPYPSALKASAFLAGNLFMNGTLYFWTHNTPVVLGGAYQYTTNDYATYNLTGGTGTAPSANAGNNNSIPSGYIAAGQSFFASASTDGTIQFNNGMREGGAENGQFFKPGKTGKETITDAHRIWLNLTNDKGAFKQMLVGYVEGATNGFDKNYDGATFDGNIYVDFYSVNNQDKLTIQGRSLPFADTDVVPLGYRTTIAGDFNISIDQADGDLASQAVYIEDKTTGVVHDLKAAKFTFTTAAGNFTDRLVLRYTNKTLGTGDFEDTENGILVSVKNKVIKVNSAKQNIKEVTIFDVSGKLLYNKKKAGTTELQIPNLQAANQVLLVKVTLDNNYTTAKKIIFQ
jgi:nucleoside phosphorylase